MAALVVFRATLPNDNDAGDNVTGRTPVPVKGAACGEFGASSMTVNVPVRDPVTVGVNVTKIAQLEFGASVFGDRGQIEDSVKSPEVAIDAIVNGDA